MSTHDDTRQRIAAVIEKYGNNGTTAEVIAQEVHFSLAALRNQIKRLISDGVVEIVSPAIKAGSRSSATFYKKK